MEAESAATISVPKTTRILCSVRRRRARAAPSSASGHRSTAALSRATGPPDSASEMRSAAALRSATSTCRPFRRNCGKPSNRSSSRFIDLPAAAISEPGTQRGRRPLIPWLGQPPDPKISLEREMSAVNTLNPRPFEAVAGDGVTIAYEDLGRGEPVVLLHGVTENRGSWHEAGYVERFLRRKRRLILVDCRGHGQSGKPRDPAAYSGRSRAADI